MSVLVLLTLPHSIAKSVLFKGPSERNAKVASTYITLILIYFSMQGIKQVCHISSIGFLR